MRIVVLFVAALVAMAAAIAANGGGGTRVVAAAPGRGFFRSHCVYSHTAPDDPILMPGMAGMSMVHDFFGNTSTSATSTAASLTAAGRTSCAAPADTSAYWVPALYQDGHRIVPRLMSIYYRTAGRMNSVIQTLPPGLEMIAGNETAMTAQPLSVAYWNCGANADVPRSALPPATCPAGSILVLSLVFPDCWNGHTLNGKAQTNVAYAVHRSCPAAHPVAIPQLSVHVRYPVASGRGLTLSMSPTANTRPASIYTAHADFVNAWTPSVLASLVGQCDAGEQLCGTVGPQNAPLGASAEEIARAGR